MQHFNASLTIWTQRLKDRAGRFIPQAQAVTARAARYAHRLARALISEAKAMIDAAQERLMERLAADKMAIRRIFLIDPRKPGKGYTKDGFILLRFLSQQAQPYAPSTAGDPIQMAQQHGARLLWARVMDAICSDIHELALLLADEEQRRNEEIVRT